MECEPSVTPKDLRRESVRRLKKGRDALCGGSRPAEMKLAEHCDKLHLPYELWPNMDLYDLQIQFPSGDTWVIDAKAYHNPLQPAHPGGTGHSVCQRGLSKGFYVVPQEYTRKYRNYLSIISDTLKQKGPAYANVQCVTDLKLKRLLKKELEEADV